MSYTGGLTCDLHASSSAPRPIVGKARAGVPTSAPRTSLTIRQGRCTSPAGVRLHIGSLGARSLLRVAQAVWTQARSVVATAAASGMAAISSAHLRLDLA